MTVVVFAGPTLSAPEILRHIDAEVRPPAAQGDVYRVAQSRPFAIGLIDGLFERGPSVWHKEILWALNEGIRVYGSASLGALRSAELSRFGMIGVGRIYESYRNGILEDDDEVCVVHAPEELGSQSLSEPLVNIRATLQAALAADQLDEKEITSLLRIAKDLHYSNRSFERVLSIAHEEGMPASRTRILANWLAANRVDQKRRDAIEMLQKMRTDSIRPVQPVQAGFAFEHTRFWDDLVREIGSYRLSLADNTLPDDMAVLDELRLEPDAKQVFQLALCRALALSEAARRGVQIDSTQLAETIDRFRRSRDLCGDGELERWLIDNGISHERFHSLMYQEAQIDWIRYKYWNSIAQQALANVELEGSFRRLADRANKKKKAIHTLGLEAPNPRHTGLTVDELIKYFFPTSQSLEDVAQFIESFHYENGAHLISNIVKEYLFISGKDR